MFTANFSAESEAEATVQSMLKPFLHYPILVETPRGQVIGVLLEAETDVYGNIWSLLVGVHVSPSMGVELDPDAGLTGDYYVVKNWYTMKTLRSRT